MLSNVEVRIRRSATSPGRLVADIPIGMPSPTDETYIRKVDGLGPVKAEIGTENFVVDDGAYMTSDRVGARNIVFRMAYNKGYSGGYDVEALRKKAYVYFPPKGLVYLYFFSNGKPYFIQGYVESHDPTIFDRNPEIMVSILCLDPYFQDMDTTTLKSPTGAPIDRELFPDGPTPFELLITRNVAGGGLFISRADAFERIYINPWPDGDMPKGSQFLLNTEMGAKRFDYRSSASGTFSKRWAWYREGNLNMRVSQNLVNQFEVTSAVNGPGVPFEISYKPRYLGL